MVCQRCFNDEEARYRAHSDIMDIMVCQGCAEEARQLEITVEDLETVKRLPAYPPDEFESPREVFGKTPARRRYPNKSINSNH